MLFDPASIVTPMELFKNRKIPLRVLIVLKSCNRTYLIIGICSSVFAPDTEGIIQKVYEVLACLNDVEGIYSNLLNVNYNSYTC